MEMQLLYFIWYSYMNLEMFVEYGGLLSRAQTLIVREKSASTFAKTTNTPAELLVTYFKIQTKIMKLNYWSFFKLNL